MRMLEHRSMSCSRGGDLTDAELVERTRQGVGGAFEALVCRHGSKFERLAESVVGDGAAADVLQRALIKIYEKLDSLRDPSSFQSWAYRVVKNEALMAIRRTDRRPEIGFGELGPGRDDERHFETTVADWQVRGDRVAENRELREHLFDAIDGLEEKYRHPFVMYEFDGLCIAAIADEIDLSEAGVKSRLHRARKKIRADLERYLRDDLSTAAVA